MESVELMFSKNFQLDILLLPINEKIIILFHNTYTVTYQVSPNFNRKKVTIIIIILIPKLLKCLKTLANVIPRVHIPKQIRGSLCGKTNYRQINGHSWT